MKHFLTLFLMLVLPLLLLGITNKSTGQNQPATMPAPSTQPHQTYVIVHGAWAGGWEWKKVGDLLLKDGQTVYRPTLTGQGERVHLASPEVDLNTHIQDIVNVIEFEDLHDVVLMGHSYGGMVITGVADRIPSRIKCLIYVDAMLPIDGESVDGFMGKKFSSTSGFIDPPGKPRSPDAKPPFIVPMSAKIFETPISLKNPAALKIPAVFIMCIDPKQPIEKSGFYKSYLRAKDRGFFTETIASGHVVNQIHPKELTAMLEMAPSQAAVKP